MCPEDTVGFGALNKWWGTSWSTNVVSSSSPSLTHSVVIYSSDGFLHNGMSQCDFLCPWDPSGALDPCKTYCKFKWMILLVFASFPHQGSDSLNLLHVDCWRTVPSSRHFNGNVTMLHSRTRHGWSPAENRNKKRHKGTIARSGLGQSSHWHIQCIPASAGLLAELMSICPTDKTHHDIYV